MTLVELDARWVVASWREPMDPVAGWPTPSDGWWGIHNIHAYPDGFRHGMGVSFECPKCHGHRVAVFFANPIDDMPPGCGDPKYDANMRRTDRPPKLWQRTGDTFETLTLTPSINFVDDNGQQVLCGWHGHVVNGSAQ